MLSVRLWSVEKHVDIFKHLCSWFTKQMLNFEELFFSSRRLSKNFFQCESACTPQWPLMMPGPCCDYSPCWSWCGQQSHSSAGTCSHRRWRVGGAVGLMWAKTNWKGRSSIGSKVATRCASPSKQSLTSQIRHRRRAASSERRVCQVLSAPLGDVQRGAETGHRATSTQPLPVHRAAPFAVKCNSSLCGIKTAFIHKQRRSETRTNAGGQEQRAAG